MRSKLLSIASTGVVLSCLSAAPIALAQGTPATSTPIKHLVVIFGENISFDHYFGTYPKAVNPPGQPRFVALAGTPSANNYQTNPTLLTNNPT